MFWAGLGDYRPTLKKTQPRMLSYFAGVLCVSGKAVYENGAGAAGDFLPGDLMLVFPDVNYCYYSVDQQPWREFWFLFDGPTFLLWRDAGILSASRPLLRLGDAEVWLKRLLEMVKPTGGSLEDQSLRRAAALLQFLADAVVHAKHLQVDPDDQAWLRKAMALVDPEKSPGAPDWHAIADRLGLTYEGFRKRFARLAGTSPAHYRAKCVMQRACQMLLRGMSVGETANACGFDDPFYFSRQFKKHMGAAPSDYSQRFSDHARR